MLTFTLAFSQYNTKYFDVNINQISGSDTSWVFPFIENVAWSLDILIDSADISSGESGSLDLMQSENEYDRRRGVSIDFASLNIYQLPVTLDSLLSPATIIVRKHWNGKIFCAKITVGSLTGSIPIKLIFTYNYLATKPK